MLQNSVCRRLQPSSGIYYIMLQNSVCRRLQPSCGIYYIMLQNSVCRRLQPSSGIYIYISYYRIASVEDYNPALPYIYIYHVTKYRLSKTTTQLCHIYIYIYIMLQNSVCRRLQPSSGIYIYISCYRIASVEDYNPALPYIYIYIYHVTEYRLSKTTTQLWHILYHVTE